MSTELNQSLEPLLVFGAHPDDIEFGCGAIVAIETGSGRRAHFVVCSAGESGTSGTRTARAAEAERAARVLGATIEFIELDGDAHLELRASHTIHLARIIRRIRPSTVLAPSIVENQHPDHSRLGQLVRDAARLARYGGVEELKGDPVHEVLQLFYYSVTPEGEPSGGCQIWIDISAAEIISKWTAAMNEHGTQSSVRNYVGLQLTRAKLLGARAGVEYAMALYPNDPIVFESLSRVGKGARRF